jgi:hypothetical protein
MPTWQHGLDPPRLWTLTGIGGSTATTTTAPPPIGHSDRVSICGRSRGWSLAADNRCQRTAIPPVFGLGWLRDCPRPASPPGCCSRQGQRPGAVSLAVLFRAGTAGRAGLDQGADRGLAVLADEQIAFRKTGPGRGGPGVAEIALCSGRSLRMSTRLSWSVLDC